MKFLPYLPYGYDKMTEKQQTPDKRLDAMEHQFFAGNNFTPCDMRVLARSPQQGEPILLGTLSMLSYSSHRDKFPVVSLGMRGVRGFTRGHRTIAGSLAFQSIDTGAFHKMVKAIAQMWGRKDTSYILADELPPFDVVVTSINEEGGSSVFSIYGVGILDFGTSFTLDQLIPNETYSFAATTVSTPQAAYDVYGNTLNETPDRILRNAIRADKLRDSAGNFETIISSVASLSLTNTEKVERMIPYNETTEMARLRDSAENKKMPEGEPISSKASRLEVLRVQAIDERLKANVAQNPEEKEYWTKRAELTEQYRVLYVQQQETR